MPILQTQLIGKYDDMKKAQKSVKDVELISFDASPPTYPTATVVKVASAKELAISDYESKINEMMSETSQERDVCYFYLESTNWDIKEAISMYKNMTEG